jgi:hypothetical protein
MQPQFPLYIPTKGRADSRLTAKALLAMNVPFFAVIEEHEYSDYAAVLDAKHLLVLDKAYQRDYDTFDELGDTKSKGPGAARNFAWDHSLANGHAWHWVMDDNIRCFWRLSKNTKIRLGDGTGFRAMEDFCLRYLNVAMAGPNYEMFAARKQKIPPFVANTRIYSCNLIRNDVPFRWRGRYNEDTDLSLRMMKAGWVTVQFNAFLQGKVNTQVMKGGNTGEFYSSEGTMAKSRMQVDMHPDVSKLVWKFGRWHHHVDYRPFAKNRLIRKPGLRVPEKNEYGLKVVTRGR